MQVERLSKITVYFILCAVLFGAKEFFLDSAAEQHLVGLSQTGAGIRQWFSEHDTANDIICSAFICINAFFITRISLRFFHFLPKNYIPAILFLCLACSSTSTQNDTTTELLLFLLLAYLERTLFLLYDRNSKRNAFEAGLILGAALLITPLLLFFYLLIPIAQLYSGTFRFREVTLPLIGGMVPLFLYAYTGWVTEGTPLSAPFNAVTATISDSFLRQSINVYQFSVPELIYIGFIAAQIVTGVILFNIQHKNAVRKHLNTYQLFVWMLVISAVLIALFYDNATMIVQTAFIPTTLILAILCLQIPNRLLKTTLFTANLLFSITLGFLQN